MAATTFIFTVRDNSATPPGTRMTGLTPTWVYLKKLSDNSDIATGTRPAVVEVAQGAYKLVYDPIVNGEVVGQLDAGSGLANPSDRFIDVLMTNDTSGNLLAALNPNQAGFTPRVLDAVADGNLTIQDLLFAAACGGVQRSAIASLAWQTRTPAGTVVRNRTLDQNPNPNSAT